MYYIIISSPSGGGKTTICNMLLSNKNSPIYGNVSFSISATTRPKRQHEVHGREYFFLSKEEFGIMINNNEFLEYANVCGNLYGTPLKGVVEYHHTLFDIDYQGFEQISRNGKAKIISIFLLPPSLKELEQRLQNRGDISQSVINERMQNALEEISHSQKYDYILTNFNIQTTFQMVCKIVDYTIHGNDDILHKNAISLANLIKGFSNKNVELYLKEALKVTQNACC
jgi:guanylate kinase